MWIDAKQADARLLHVELAQGSDGGSRRPLHQFRRNARECRVQPFMQGDVETMRSPPPTSMRNT